MPSAGDGIVLVLILIGGLAWLLWRTRGIRVRLPIRKLPFLSDAQPLAESIHTLLLSHGYQGIGGKLRVPLTVRVDGKKFASRLFIDGFAQKEEGLYVIRLERDRMPIEWTGSGIREKLLAYALLYPDTKGILYINETDQTVKEIHFEFDSPN